MIKRWYILLCALFLLCSPQALLAASLSIGQVTGAAGATAQVGLSIATAGAQVSGLELKIAYDPAQFSAAPTVTRGAAATADTSFSSQVSTGLITIIAYPSVDGAVIGDGTLATMTFPVKADAVGALPVTFSVAPLLSDPLGAAIATTYTNGGISIPDTAAPTVSAFTIPGTSTTKTITITGITATDNLGVTGYLVTESATAPAASLTTWSATVPASYDVTAAVPVALATPVTLYAWAKDAAGNVSASRPASVTITLPDTTAPTVTGVTVPSTSTSLTVAVSGFTATDAVGVTGYLLTETSAAPSATDTAWKTAGSGWTSFTFSSGGAKTLYAWAKDAAGNISTAAQRSVTITLPDSEAPTVSAFTIPATATSLTIPVSTFTATDNTAVSGYLVTESSTKPAATATGWSATAPAGYLVTGTVPQGVATDVTLYGWAKDAAGNVSAALSDVVAITLPDTTKPVVGTFTVPATATSATVNVTVAATDNLAVTGYLVNESATAPAADATGWSATAPTSYSFTGLPQGTTDKTLYAWAKDAAGNVSEVKSAPVSITLTGPSLALPTMLADGATTKNPALTVAGTVSGTSLSGLTVQVNAGAPQDITYDTTSGAFSTAVTLAEGANTVVVSATDANGTTTVTRNITLNPSAPDLDVTAPLAGSFVKSSLVDVTGTVGAPQTTTVTIALNGGAAQNVELNGGNGFTYQLVLVNGVNTIVVTATDSLSGPHTVSITLTYDPDAPVLAVSAPGDSFATAKSSVVLTGTVEDALTAPTLVVKVDNVELATQPVVTDGAFSTTIDLPTVKSYAVTVTATDESGNSSVVTRTVIRKNPSGSVADGVSPPTIADVQKVLNFALGLETATADQQTNVDVAPLVDGKPAPDGSVDAGDALVILEKVIGVVSWQ